MAATPLYHETRHRRKPFSPEFSNCRRRTDYLLLSLCHFHHPTTPNQPQHVTATVNMRVGATTTLNRTSVALTILALCMLLLLFLLR